MIDFIATDPDALLKDAIARYEAVSGETFYPGDEHYMFLAQMLQLIVSCRESINTAANQNLLRYCSGDVLDEYGGQYGVSRLPAQTATATMQFNLPSALAFDVTIPAGMRVTPDGLLIFSLQKDVLISAGQTSAQGMITAELPGAAYNGFQPGQIQSIVDPADYVGSASNVTASVGGSDREDDDSYRERIRMSWEAISTAGSKESYEYWAKTASLNIVDVEAVKTATGEVTVYILMDGAAAPTQIVLDAVSAACGAENHRPLSDKVTVAAAQVKQYDITLTYYVSKARSTEEAAIKTAVGQQVNDFISVQKKQLGGNLNPDSLRSMMLASGAYRVDLTSPSFTALQPQEVAVANNVSVTYGGLL